jgi:hypothetical protein
MLVPKYQWPAKRNHYRNISPLLSAVMVSLMVEHGDMIVNRPEERRILELLALLKGQNRVAAVKNFEEYFFENRPR